MKIKALAAAAALSMAALSAGGAHATTCLDTDVTPNASACTGFFSGNQLNNSDISTVQSELSSAFGFNWDGSTLVYSNSGLGGAHSVTFATPLGEPVIFGIHFGNGTGGPGNGTAFYEITKPSTITTISWTYNASSNFWVFEGGAPTTGVPEPATWAMMIAGLALTGGALRASRKRAALA